MKRSGIIGLLVSLLLIISSMVYAADMTQKELEQFWHNIFDKHVPKNDGAVTPLSKKILSRAEKDACFNGVGKPYPDLPCNEGQPKVDQEYLFSMAKSGSDIWFGTSANQFCTVVGTYLDEIQQVIQFPEFALETESFVCEFGFSDFRNKFIPPNPNLDKLPAALGDWRPPKMYVYNTQNNTRTDKTPDDDLIKDTVGIRASGIIGNTVIMGGPNLIASYSGLSEHAGCNFFVFRADTGDYVGSKVFLNYVDVRKWLVVGDYLYTAVRYKDGTGGVLKWTGNPDSTNIDEILQFEEVGLLDAEGAELAYQDGRIFVTTWAQPMDSGTSGIYVSPVVPVGGLTKADLNSWTRIWGAEDYEPDPVLAKAYFMGAVTSFDGYVYWGTINFPLVSFLTHMMVYNPSDPIDIIMAFLGSWRNISIFRAKDFDSNPLNPTIEVVNGYDFLPAYSPGTGWSLQPNKTGPVLYGLPGFGNIFNAYTWTMATYSNQLYVGTMDWSYMAYDVVKMLIKPYLEDCEDCQQQILDFVAGFLEDESGVYMGQSILEMFLGADLWRFPGSDAYALPQSLNGLGNNAAYGIRNMLVDDGLYLGTANVANLLADPQVVPRGGWELVRLAEPTIAADTDKLNITADGVSTAIISATVTDGNGNPVADGTVVTFTTDYGSFASLSITKPTVNGVATATLTSELSAEILVATIITRVYSVQDAVALFFEPAGVPGVKESKTVGIAGSGSTNDTVGGIAEVQVESSNPGAIYYLTTAEYAGNVCSNVMATADGYWDVHLNSVADITEVKVKFCPVESGDKIYYCSGSGWKPFSSQAYANGCIVITVNSTTTPDLDSLKGLPFALVKAPPPVPVPAVSGRGLFILCLFMAGSALWVIRRRGLGNFHP